MRVKRCRAVDSGMALSNKNWKRSLSEIHFPEKRGRKTGKGQGVQTTVSIHVNIKLGYYLVLQFLEADKQLQLMQFICSEIQMENYIIVRMGTYNNVVIQEYFCE